MKTTHELVRQLPDREAIRDLPIRYCDCISRNGLADIVSLFTEDGSFVVKNPESSVEPKLKA
ncbi:MAG: nuclear transport factor 2 family protein [Candidatus Binataceae bacterium]|jgi:hypothetical protein